MQNAGQHLKMSQMPLELVAHAAATPVERDGRFAFYHAKRVNSYVYTAVIALLDIPQLAQGR